tara:strand:- start:246 stop:824 length:579 start_codon:yes stop_codon:yes gene_type:complete
MNYIKNTHANANAKKMLYVNPKIWGPPTWNLIHQLAYNYDESLKDNYQLFFDHFKDLIPCINCRISYNNIINRYPINLNNKQSFIEWTIQIHNLVNRKTNKPYIDISYANLLYSHKINNKLTYNFISTFSTAYINEHGNLIKCKELFKNLFKIYPDITTRNKLMKITRNDNNWDKLYTSKILISYILLILNK